jgi:hypothetical protein
MPKLRNYSAPWRNLLTQLNESPPVVGVTYDTDAWHDALNIEIYVTVSSKIFLCTNSEIVKITEQVSKYQK